MNARRVSSLAVALFALAAAVPAMGQAQPTKTGVVNMGKVVDLTHGNTGSSTDSNAQTIPVQK